MYSVMWRPLWCGVTQNNLNKESVKLIILGYRARWRSERIKISSTYAVLSNQLVSKLAMILWWSFGSVLNPIIYLQRQVTQKFLNSFCGLGCFRYRYSGENRIKCWTSGCLHYLFGMAWCSGNYDEIESRIPVYKIQFWVLSGVPEYRAHALDHFPTLNILHRRSSHYKKENNKEIY